MSRQVEFRRDVEAIRRIESGREESLDEFHMRILFVKIVYRLRRRVDFAAARIEWNLDPAFENDLRRLEGFWQLYALDAARTLGEFGTLVDVGPALPAAFQDLATRSTLPRTLEHCRRWVDSGGSWRP